MATVNNLTNSGVETGEELPVQRAEAALQAAAARVAATLRLRRFCGQRGAAFTDWDVALHLVFADKAAHDRYQDHPDHVKFIVETLKDSSINVGAGAAIY